MVKYRVTHLKGFREFNTESDADVFAVEIAGTKTEIVIEPNAFDYKETQQQAMRFGENLAIQLALELGAKAKQLRIENGLNVGSSLIDINSKLEKYLKLGALYPDALSEISLIVDSGQVDNFLPIYASAVLQIEDFLNA